MWCNVELSPLFSFPILEATLQPDQADGESLRYISLSFIAPYVLLGTILTFHAFM